MSDRAQETVVVAAHRAARDVVSPLHMSDSYRWDGPDDKPAPDYSRSASPNRDELVARLADLEGAVGGAVTGSGQSAALLMLLLLPAKARVIAPHDCYGGTYRLLEGFAQQGRIAVEWVDLTDLAALDAALDTDTALVWIETPSNPLLRLTDIVAVCDRARAAGALTIADNTLPTPCRQSPLALGCDLVMHSTTKAINGHGDCVGGALLARDADLVERIEWWANSAGLLGSPNAAVQTLRGLRTLPLRVQAMEAGARKVAAYLAQHDAVAAVHYPGLADHPDHALAERQQAGPGFMIAFELKGGRPAVDAFLARLELVTLASSLGAHASLICVPSSMTHRGMPPEAQARAGIAPGLLRLSVGLEAAEDIVVDLAQALDV